MGKCARCERVQPTLMSLCLGLCALVRRGPWGEILQSRRMAALLSLAQRHSLYYSAFILPASTSPPLPTPGRCK
ncbi:unnamed protein product [Boreogadus saida]